MPAHRELDAFGRLEIEAFLAACPGGTVPDRSIGSRNNLFFHPRDFYEFTSLRRSVAPRRAGGASHRQLLERRLLGRGALGGDALGGSLQRPEAVSRQARQRARRRSDRCTRRPGPGERPARFRCRHLFTTRCAGSPRRRIFHGTRFRNDRGLRCAGPTVLWCHLSERCFL